MTGNRKLRQGIAGRPEPKLGQLCLVSLVLHVLVFLVFSGIILPRFSPPRRDVYYVDLVNLPVERPQAGRPEARPAPPAREKPKPEPVKQAPPPSPPKPKPQPQPEKAPLKTVAPKPQPPPKPAPAPVKEAAKQAPPAASYDDVQARIEAMQRQREMEELKAKLAALATGDTRAESPIPDAPVGMPEGQGDQAGVSQRAWLEAFFKANWSLSKYQVTRRNLQARVEVRYDSSGNLLDYRLLDPSGDQTFDDSVKRAVLREKQLPFEPGRPLKEEVVFNLKDLME